MKGADRNRRPSRFVTSQNYIQASHAGIDLGLQRRRIRRIVFFFRGCATRGLHWPNADQNQKRGSAIKCTVTEIPAVNYFSSLTIAFDD
jgi:hypothetical protein